MFFKAVDVSRLNGDLEATDPSYMVLPLSGRIENTRFVRNYQPDGSDITLSDTRAVIYASSLSTVLIPDCGVQFI